MIEQLMEVYLAQTNFPHLSIERAEEYFRYLINKGNILTYEKEGRLIGFIEFWRINYEQVGRAVLGIPIYVMDEDISTGKVCYVSDLWVRPEERKGNLVLKMKKDLEEINKGCLFFIGKRVKDNKISKFRRG